MYTAEQIDEMRERAGELYAQCFELQEKLIIMAAKMPAKAKEHAIYGVARRLGTLRESMLFFFDHLPPHLNEEAESKLKTVTFFNVNSSEISKIGIFIT